MGTPRVRPKVFVFALGTPPGSEFADCFWDGYPFFRLPPPSYHASVP